MEDKIKKSWEYFLTPEILRFHLLVGSLYIATFEILKERIIKGIEDFYTSGLDENGLIIDETYYNEVLTKNNSPVYASLQWLKEKRVIDETDIILFDETKQYRNKIAHEIQKIIMEGFPDDLPEYLSKIITLLNKIESWWIINVEIPTDPDLYNKDIDEDGIIPGSIASLKMMFDIALGTDETANFYIEEFRKQGLI